MSRDYLAMVTPEPEDKVDHGVKGMRWGIRRSPAQLKSAAAKRGEGDSSTDATKKPDGPESAQQRYTRLKAQATEKGPSSLDDADLKFFNARTEAIAKVAKITEQKPGWLSETAKKVVRTTAERQLQSLSDNMANKYINENILKSLNKPDTIEDTIKKGVRDEIRRRTVAKGIKEGVEKATKKK